MVLINVLIRSIFIARQHAMHTERNIVAANPSIRPMSNAGTGLNDRHIVTFSRSGRGIIVVF